MLCLTPENLSSNSARTSRSAHQVEENLRRHGEEADRPKRFRGWRHHIEDGQYELSDLLDDQLRVSVGLVVFGQNVVAGRDPLLADHQDDDLEGLHEGCCLLRISWELGPELRSHRCSHIPCELHFCTSDQLTLSRGLLGIKAFFLLRGHAELRNECDRAQWGGARRLMGPAPLPAIPPTAPRPPPPPRVGQAPGTRAPPAAAPPVLPARSTAWGVGGTNWAVGGALRGAEGAEVENRPSRGPF